MCTMSVSGEGRSPDYEPDKARHDKMVSLAERMLKLHKDLPEARTAPDKTASRSDER
jgi:hypothetical protein